ncbi:hypothetical protein B4102_2797 [Heyndrickxia sporothermodurans]|uniref:Threonine efflux protein n=2 Tax=Bacillaceae TaxID=186817 RepID=A0A150L8E4_9BACI|nr:hypothetical protein B4102_2797 [Heyndrickxia sporothermodurans]
MFAAKNLSSTNHRSKDSLRKSFSSGFIMSISNPLSILFWIGIYGSVLAKSIQTAHSHDIILHSMAIFIGLFLWDVTMAVVASSFRKWLSSRLLTWISFVSGLGLIGFGIYFGKEAIILLFF